MLLNDDQIPVIGISACAAEGVGTIREFLVDPLLQRGYRVAVTPTPTAERWLSHSGEAERIQQLTGLPVRSASRLPTEARPHPRADCHAVVPATAASVAKLALGIGDNQALTPVCEAIGDPDVDVVVFPRVNAAHSAHPAWKHHLATLRAVGVHLVHGDHVWSARPPRQDPDRPYPWQAILNAIDHTINAKRFGAS